MFAFTFGVVTLTSTLALRLVCRVFAFLLLVELKLSAMKTAARPTPIISTASRPPSTHQIAFDRLAGGVGPGVHCCGGSGDGDGGGVVGLGLGAACAGR